jgi:hypothetical protein
VAKSNPLPTVQMSADKDGLRVRIMRNAADDLFVEHDFGNIDRDALLQNRMQYTVGGMAAVYRLRNALAMIVDSIDRLRKTSDLWQ